MHRTTDSESSSLPTPATSEPGFTFQPVDKDGNPTNNPNERWYHPETGRLVQKGIKQALASLPTPRAQEPSSTSPGYGDSLNDFANRVTQGYAKKDLLRTPAASEAERGHQPASKAKARGGQQTLTGQFMEMFPTPTAQAAKHGSTPDTGSNTPLGANLWDLPHVLPTPNTMDSLPVRSEEAHERQLRRGGKGSRRKTSGNLREDIIYELPTPTTRDYKDGSAEHRRDGKVQTDTVALAVFNSGEVLLPTTRARMNEASKNEIAKGNPYKRIETEVLLGEINWGKFEPAIRRWEATIGRPAPAPTKPDGKDGNHRLSSAFTEWMMGLPEGWITDVGLSRNEELKACGNGVVPQQAELALRVLLEGLLIEPGGGQVNLPTPTVSDTFTDNLKSSQQKPGSMHSVTLPQAVKWVADEH